MKCNYCLSVFINRKDLKKHILCKHKKFYYPCNICSEYFRTQKDLKKHKKDHSIDKMTEVSLKKPSSDVKNLKASKQSEYKYLGSKFQCVECRKFYKSFDNLCKHRREMHNTGPSLSSRRSRERSSWETEKEFFNNIASMVRNNLMNHVDGTESHIKRSKFISSRPLPDQNIQKLDWTTFNFPSNFEINETRLKPIDYSSLHQNYFSDLSKLKFKEKPKTIYICSVCCGLYNSLESLNEHQINNHVNIVCRHIKLEEDENVPSSVYPLMCGINSATYSSNKLPLSAQENHQFTCTKCKEIFTTVENFHLHILECADKTDSHNKTSNNIPESSDLTETENIYDIEEKENENTEHLPKNDPPPRSNCHRKFQHIAALEKYELKCLTTKNGYSRGKENDESIDSNSEKETEESMFESFGNDTNSKTRSFSDQSSSKHWCRYCKRFFAYLGNFKKHMSDRCPVKKQIKEDKDFVTDCNVSGRAKETKRLSVRNQVEQSMIGLHGHQSRQAEVMGSSDESGSSLRHFTCKFPGCHKIFFVYIESLKHSLSHKLQ